MSNELAKLRNLIHDDDVRLTVIENALEILKDRPLRRYHQTIDDIMWGILEYMDSNELSELYVIMCDECYEEDSEE